MSEFFFQHLSTCLLFLNWTLGKINKSRNIFTHCFFHSACEGRNMWSHRCPPLLQQEQDRGEISDGQMFLFPGSSCRHHSGDALLRWWYVSPDHCCHMFWMHLHIPTVWQTPDLNSVIWKCYFLSLVFPHSLDVSLCDNRLSYFRQSAKAVLALWLWKKYWTNVLYTEQPDIYSALAAAYLCLCWC